MKKRMRRLISFTLALFLVLSLLPTSALAEETAEQTTTEKGMAYFASETEQVLGEGRIEGSVTRKPVYAEKDNGYYTDVEEAIALLRERMVDRRSVIEIPLRVSKTDAASVGGLQALIEVIFAMAAAHTGVEDQGDYLLWSVAKRGYNATYTETNSYYYLDIPYEFTYYTTLEQEVSVGRKLDSIFASFGFTEQTDDYTKIKTIYDYICANVTYDYANLENDAYTLKYTAYAALNNGTAVCQGYATLLYRMLLRAGVDCRGITGVDDNNEPHAWNIVALDGIYYNLDSTWDAAGNNEYQYFLKGTADFPDHYRDETYDSAEFHILYPMAALGYSAGEAQVVAQGTCGEGVNWVLMSDGILTVSGNGAMDDYEKAEDTPWYDYRDYVLGVVVEAGGTHVGKFSFYSCPRLQAVSCAATTIGEYAFAKNEALIAVDLLEGLEEIGKEAFASCAALTAVSIPASLKKSGDRAFGNCGALKAVVISDLAAWCNIEFVPYYQYGKDWYYSNPLCENAYIYLNDTPVTELVIPENITSISAGAFWGANLTSVIMHDNVSEVATHAFYHCPLTHLELSAGLETIQPHTFSTALNIETLVIPEGVKRIESQAFGQDATSMAHVTAVHFPASLEYLGNQALEAEQIYLADLAAWCGVEIAGNRVPAYLGADYYVGGELITDLVIPDGVTEIKAYTFMGSSIQSLTLPDSVVSIGDHAFRWSQGKASQLSRVTWSKNLQSIGTYAFANCALEKLVLPDSLKILGDGAFSQNRNLASIHIGAGMTKLSNNAFSGAAITELTLPSHVTELGTGTFSGCDKLTQLDLGNSLTTIPDGAFSGCSALTEVVIPNRITAIGKGAFQHCEGLQKVTIGSGVKTIPSDAFKSCKNLVEITIGAGVERVEEHAFYQCSNLKRVIFLGSVKELDRWIFRNCRNLDQIIFAGDAPQFDKNTLDDMRDYIRLTTILYPCTNPTWTEDVFQGYGHETVQWVPNHVCKDGKCTLCGEMEITLNGSCGSNVYWTLDVNGVLNVYGHGDISYSPLDTKEQLASAVVIDNGITHITSKVFNRGYKNLETITFKGDAPTFGEYAFDGLTATAYYPTGNPTWTEEVRQQYGGNITWVAACTAHSFENGVCTVCGEKDPDFNPDGLLGDADGSGVVDYVDAMLVLQYHTGVITNEALTLAQCDVDGSGAVDYVDAMRILQYHTGVISGF